MRTMLKVGVAGIVLSLSCVGAQALTPIGQAADPYATFNEQSLTDNSASQAVGGQPKLAMGAGSATEVRSAHGAQRGGAETSVSKFILLVAAAVVVSLSAIGAVAVRVIDGLEFSPGGVTEQLPYGLLRSNLAILDSLLRGYSRRETQT